MTLTIKCLNVQRFSAENWKKAIDFRKRYAKQTFPNEPEPNFEHWQAMMPKYHSENPTYHFYNIFLEEKIIAQIWHLKLNVGEKNEEQNIHIYHDVNFESEKLFDLISEKIMLWKTESCFTIVTTQTDFAHKIMVKNNFFKSNPVNCLSLKTKEMKTTQLEEWKSYLPQNFSYSIIENPNETELVEIAAVTTFLLNDMKRSDKSQTFEEKTENIRSRFAQSLIFGTTYRYLLIRNADLELIGLSLLYYNRKDAVVCTQRITGTLPKYRRKGLTKFMKAAMYLFLQKEEPNIQLIKTECFSDNDKMLNLNMQMGFKTDFILHEWFFRT